MREAGQRVQPNLSRFSVASIIQTFRNEHRTARLPYCGGRGRLLTDEQETAVVNMVLANNVITLRQIRDAVIADQHIFQNIATVSLSTVDRVLQRSSIRMKQVYRVPFERNTARIKEIRHDYVQRYLDLDAAADLHEFIFIDEAGFNLVKRRRRGRNVIGQRAVIEVPGQRGGNVTMCAAINHHGVLHHHATLGPYNTAHLIAFLDTLYNIVVQPDQMDDTEVIRFVVVWDNVSFHRAALVRDWFRGHPEVSVLHLPPYSPFLNPIEEFFSAWRWKVYERNPQTRIPLLQAMEDACGDVTAEACQGFMRHCRRFFPRCLAREDIACDEDEVLWPARDRRQDAA
ncbi:uncharacterized protein LOC126399166 [Epinephelus moara]|uniref:uncharacterized protein LOC126399166 n=1 Tax=Epinephelus moara TaxID=300413 RepID=UPI00214F5838|nr:uncharacterized protein LOC126399166 [Epinephelus moara]